MPRTVKEPEQRKQEILDAALALFCEKGYERTSIGDIAKSLGIAQGLCYRYFPSKEALLDCAVDQYARYQVGQMLPVLCDENRTLRQKLMDAPTFLDFEDTGDSYYKICHSADNLKIHNQLSHRICELLTPLVKKQLDLAARRGEISCRDTETTAAFIVYGQQGMLSRFDLPGEERVERIRGFLLDLLIL